MADGRVTWMTSLCRILQISPPDNPTCSPRRRGAASITSALLLIMGMAGIAILMRLVVRERASEIGLRRALGAVHCSVLVRGAPPRVVPLRSTLQQRRAF